MANSKRKCGGCGKYFKPLQSFPGPVAWCSPECGLIVARKRSIPIKAKQERQARAEAKERVKTRSEWLKEAQAEFNRYIRLRDANLPCISCQRHHSGQYHAGHYRSVGSCPELRYDERNVHKQCSACNAHLSGNLIAYRASLLQKVGEEVLAWIEGPHEPKRYTIEDLKRIKAEYARKAKCLEKLSQHQS